MHPRFLFERERDTQLHVNTRAVDMHSVDLRGKLADPSDAPEVVLTVRGKVYMLAQAAAPEGSV